MHIHLKVHRWVLWWFYVGVVFGAIAVVNIFTRNLNRTQEDVVLVLGVLHWVLGGVVCWAFDGVRIHPAPPVEKTKEKAPPDRHEEWHPASDFVLPGNRKTLLPRKY